MTSMDAPGIRVGSGGMWLVSTEWREDHLFMALLPEDAAANAYGGQGRFGASYRALEMFPEWEREAWAFEEAKRTLET